MMRRTELACIALTLAMWGCSALTGSTALPATPVSPSPSATAVVAPAVTATAPGTGECYYVWATSDLPQVSDRLNSALKALGPESSGSAYAYGEDCVQADGTRTFAAMETDFQIRVSVADVDDKDKLGDWIAKIMSVILAIPGAQLQGPRSGRVEFEFTSANEESRRLTVDVATYKARAADLQGARLYDLLVRSP